MDPIRLAFPLTEEQSMLVLTREKGESIHIGDGITIMVVAVDGFRVRIGIEAPPQVTVLRAELQNALEAALSTHPQ